MNKTFRSFLLLLSSSFLLASCNAGDSSSSSVVEEGIYLSQSSLTLEAYESWTLTCTLVGKEGTPSWSSSDPGIASVDSNGNVNAKKAGSCTISASLGELKASCSLTVTALSQAPRIVLSEQSVSVEKDGTYQIEAYALYKNEARDDVLEFSLQSGSEEGVASLSYANQKITISGLAYGQADFVVHANVLGVLLTSKLHVDVVNPDLSLKLGNLSPKEGEYSLDLGLYHVDEDSLPSEFAPEVVFTDKGEQASFALTYTSSDSSIASWDESHKILAKGVGEAVLKIACEQFKLSVEIKVSVIKGAYEVTLKNIDEAGGSTSEKVGANKAPKTTPSIEGKTFLGWFDEDGSKVTSVTKDLTLYAHYSVEHEYSGNAVLKKFTTDAQDYTKPEGVDWLYATRAGDREADIKNGYYPAGEDGTQCFLYPSTMAEVAGLGLPAYDFSTSPTVRFHFGFSDTAKEVKLNGTSLGDDSGVCRYTNYSVTIRGKEASVYSKATGITTSITLSDDVYYGRKGLEIQATEVAQRWLMVTPFINLEIDYISDALAIESSLPEEPIIGYQSQIDAYKELRELYSEGEETLFPISEKMQSWIDGYTVYTLTDYTNNAGVAATGDIDASSSAYQEATSESGSRWGGAPVFDGDSRSFIAKANSLTSSFASITFPKVDFSAYKTVSFSFGMAGNIGSYADRYFLLGDAPSTIEEAPEASNFIGIAVLPSAGAWTTANDITGTISNGKITFKGTNISEKTFTLSEAIYKGEEGLKLSFGNLCYEYLVVSPFLGYKV